MTDKEKVVQLYDVVNRFMCILGCEGEIDTTHQMVGDVMDALYEIDNGEYSTKYIEDLLSRVENTADQRQELMFK